MTNEEHKKMIGPEVYVKTWETREGERIRPVDIILERLQENTQIIYRGEELKERRDRNADSC